MVNLKKNINGKKLIINIDNENANYYIKNTKKIRKYCDKNNIILKFNYDIIKDKKLKRDLFDIENAINIKDKKERYIYIYDKVCNYLDKNNNGYCEFSNNICIRDKLMNNNHLNGCCECIGRGKCIYLINGVCTLNNCISCKLFTCKILKKIGVKENINNYVLLKYFFNNKQKDILKFSYWTPKKIIIDRLIKNNYVRPRKYK